MLGMGLQGRQWNGADRSMLRAALYYRVSTEEQVEGYSLDAQAHAVKLYGEAHG
jgi:hypothetical protein